MYLTCTITLQLTLNSTCPTELCSVACCASSAGWVASLNVKCYFLIAEGDVLVFLFAVNICSSVGVCGSLLDHSGVIGFSFFQSNCIG